MTETRYDAKPRVDVLDGWRAISILSVLATHLIWLGPRDWQLNETAGPFGMALFFTLSGYLITSNLLRNSCISNFLVRRFFRIAPLAWLFLLLVLPISGAGLNAYIPHFLFYGNLPPFWLTSITSHYWSLCVEVQFYVCVATLVAFAGRRGLIVLPLICVFITCNRVMHGEQISIVSYYRMDEILAGCTLALAHSGSLGKRPMALLKRCHWAWLLLLLGISSHPATGPLNYLRPYFAAALVGATLSRPETWLAQRLLWQPLAYVAEVSYALYVIHPLLAHSWLGSGEGWAKYLKRPLLFGVLFGMAHVSTFWFEKRWINLGKRLSSARTVR